MPVEEFVISVAKGRNVRAKEQRIKELFKVDNVAFPTDRSSSERTGIEWIKITGEESNLAKEYIESLCNAEQEEVVVISEQYFVELTYKNGQHHKQLERETLAVVDILSNKELFVQGTALSFIKAKSLIEERSKQVIRSSTARQDMRVTSTSSKPMLNGSATCHNGSTVTRSVPDGHCSNIFPKGTHMPYPPRPINNFRTAVPAVPGADYSDIVPKGACIPHAPKPMSNSRTAMPFQIPGNLRDFAQKLGYTDYQVHTAVLKLGNRVNENSLLQELISMGSQRNTDIDNDIVARGSHLGQHDIVARGSQLGQHDIVARGSHLAQYLSSDTNLNSRRTERRDIYVPDSSQKVYKTGDQARLEPALNMPPSYNWQSTDSDLRHIVVDGSNVAMSHGNREVFSCKGIQICVDYFRNMGHKEITVFVPQWRKEASKPETPITNQEILNQLEKEKILVFTPSRRVNGRRVVCYDDRYIVRLASESDGIIVSNDNFRDLEKENPEWKQVIDQRLLMYTFVNDRFMPPDDPLGRHGPTLREFLRKGTPLHPRLCPYGRKCTYGQKCRFYHPERLTNTSIRQSAGVYQPPMPPAGVCQPHATYTTGPKRPEVEAYQRAEAASNMNIMTAKLEEIFGKEAKDRIQNVLRQNPGETDIEKLVNKLLT